MKFSLLLLTLAAALARADDQLAQQILDKNFPANGDALKIYNDDANHLEDKLKECRFVAEPDKDKAAELKELSGYCMRLVSDKTVAGRRYLIFAGDSLYTAHSESGLVSLFAFDKEGKDGTPARQFQGHFGRYGDAPDEWSWQEYGKDIWGASAYDGDLGGGAGWSWQVMLIDDGKEIRLADVPTSYGNFIEDEGEEVCEPEDLAECKGLDAEYKVRQDLPAVAGLYPLEATVNGFIGMKKGEKGAKPQRLKEFKNEKFLFSYDADKHNYVKPKDFPRFSEGSSEE